MAPDILRWHRAAPAMGDQLRHIPLVEAAMAELLAGKRGESRVTCRRRHTCRLVRTAGLTST
jgi:hypothetical protein